MSTRLKALLGLGAVLLLVLIIGAGLVWYLITKGFPQETGSISVRGLTLPAEVSRDDYGVPHITAENDHDAYVAVGFVHAQERLWQMELIRRAGQGRLAEVLGAPALKTDKMFRTLGLVPHTALLAAALDADTRAALEAYADGVNEFIRTHKDKLPIEFDMLQIDPEPWRIEHSLLVSRLMGWELNFARWTDLLLAELVARFGEDRARELFPEWASDGPTIIPKYHKGALTAADLPREWFDAERSWHRLIGVPGFQSGSNAWVVNGTHTVTGKPILANDPHLAFMTPGRWYELHVETPTLNVAGCTIPGIPFVVLGRNAAVAWGVTNAMMDDEDFYLEEVDSVQHPTRYRMKEGWQPISVRSDTILVKDELPVILSVYATHRGPIINRMEAAGTFARTLVSMRWTGHEITQEAAAFFRLNRARNWNEFREALRSFGLPAQNFVYGDTSGTIAYRTGGLLPIRRQKGATLPYPGQTDAFDWKGFVPFDEMPESVNPASGYIATANNKIIDDSFPYHLSNHWEPAWRAQRINEVLRESPQVTMEDMARLQLDRISPHARAIAPLIIRAFLGHEEGMEKDVQTALTYFRNWNYDQRQEDVTTSLFEATFLHIVRNTLADEMGPELFGIYDTLATIPLTVVTRLLQDSTSSWFDNIQTRDVVETRDDIIRRSLSDAIADLRRRLGGEMKEWQWGRLHQVTFGHVFGANDLLRPIFNVGPYPVGGSHSTVNKGDFSLGKPFQNTVGPSTRQIYDLADRNNTRSIVPPGQSGHVFSEHYKDQMTFWLNGVLKSLPMDRSRWSAGSRRTLRLVPEQE